MVCTNVSEMNSYQQKPSFVTKKKKKVMNGYICIFEDGFEQQISIN